MKIENLSQEDLIDLSDDDLKSLVLEDDYIVRLTKELKETTERLKLDLQRSKDQLFQEAKCVQSQGKHIGGGFIVSICDNCGYIEPY